MSQTAAQSNRFLTEVFFFCFWCNSSYQLSSSTLLKSQGGFLENTQTGDSIVLLRDVITHLVNDSDSWKDVIRRNILPDLNQSFLVELQCQSQSVLNKLCLSLVFIGARSTRTPLAGVQ